MSNASSTCAALTASTTPSAGTRSPALSSTTSPATISLAGRSAATPSRSTLAWSAIERFSAAAVASARCSCTMSSTVETITTVTMIAKLAASPVAPATTAATSRIAINGLASLRSRPRSTPLRAAAPSSLRPSRSSRLAASRLPSPARLLCRRASTASGGSRQKGGGATTEAIPGFRPIRSSPCGPAGAIMRCADIPEAMRRIRAKRATG